MRIRQCPKCKSENIHETELEPYSPNNIFGFTQEDYKKVPPFSCKNCKHSWGNRDVIKEGKDNWANNISDFSSLSLSAIADIIFSDWKNVDFNALPYLEAMINLENINDSYGNENADSIVSYFLGNSKKWKGETARKVKTHLRKIVADYYKKLAI